LGVKQNADFENFGIIFLLRKLTQIVFFMNYKYPNENPFIEINPKEKSELYPAQLYHHTAGRKNLFISYVLNEFCS
tara:strand:+ start:321 stop:548 length:228 start_codon:yes stop_codon:yes gene_type:complete